MIEIKKDDLDFTTIHISGRLARDDYAAMVPRLEKLLNNGETRWLVELDDFKGFTPGGLAEELKFDLRHRKDFERVAVVEDSAAVGLGVKLVRPFFDGEVKVFDKSERRAAADWVRRN